MAQEEVRTTVDRWKELLGDGREFFKNVIQEVFQQMLEAEIRWVSGHRGVLATAAVLHAIPDHARGGDA